jgi:hypothetical protein
MPLPKFITIDGKRHLWRDLLQRRREQLESCTEPAQPALFELREDNRPAADCTAEGRYREPSLFSLLDGRAGQ